MYGSKSESIQQSIGGRSRGAICVCLKCGDNSLDVDRRLAMESSKRINMIE